MELSITTPGLLFPAVSLMMLAHTNRFLALAQLIRTLHSKYKTEGERQHIVVQIRNLKRRIRMIRSMQLLGVLSFLLCAVCMFCIMKEWTEAAELVFAASIVSFAGSLVISLFEIMLSLKALEVELSDMEE